MSKVYLLRKPAQAEALTSFDALIAAAVTAERERIYALLLTMPWPDMGDVKVDNAVKRDRLNLMRLIREGEES